MFNNSSLIDIEIKANHVVIDQMLMLSKSKLSHHNTDYNKKLVLFWENRKVKFLSEHV